MEVSQSPEGDMNQPFYKSENILTVEPRVFKNETFKVFYEYKIIEQLHFESVEEFDAICKNTLVQR